MCVFSKEMEDSRLSCEADFNFPPKLWQDSSLHGGSRWIQKLGASVVTPVGSTHTHAELVEVRASDTFLGKDHVQHRC